jgi:hypothetical protein
MKESLSFYVAMKAFYPLLLKKNMKWVCNWAMFVALSANSISKTTELVSTTFCTKYKSIKSYEIINC